MKNNFWTKIPKNGHCGVRRLCATKKNGRYSWNVITLGLFHGEGGEGEDCNSTAKELERR